MLGSVYNLEVAIAKSIRIPNELQHNFMIRTTGLGGVFLEFYSDSTGGVNTMNSLTQFSISFDTTDGMGRYIGDNVGMERRRYRNIKPFRSIKKKQPYTDVVDKLNRWIEKNRQYLYNSIQA